MLSWKSVVGKLWMTIIGLVAVVLFMLGSFLIQYIDTNFANSNDVKRLFIYTGIIGFLLTTFFALFLSTRITKPLLDLKKAADSISKGDYDAKVTFHSSDELGQLGRAFNLMAEQLEETIEDLKHEKEHLGSVLRSMSDAVITFDATGHIILVNPQGENVLQQWGNIKWDSEVDGDEDAGDRNAEPSERSVPEPLLDIYESVVNTTQEMTASLHVHDGVWSVVMTPLYTNDTVRGAVAVMRDVTEEHRLVKLRKDFVANVSHELRTPLSMLQGYSEALLDDIAASPQERMELAQIIHEESLRMSRLVKDLLDLTTMEVGQLTLNQRHILIHELIDCVVRKFTSTAKGVQLTYVVAEQLPAIYCDEDRIEQVLINLIDNALRHTKQGSQIEVRASIVQSEESGHKPMLLIEVEDEGEGIPAEDLGYIFERFYKADKARKREGSGGTGLGLSIVKNIVEAHGGFVKVRSVVGEGAVFSVYIPIE